MAPFLQDHGRLDGFIYSWTLGARRWYWTCPGLHRLGQGWTLASELEARASAMISNTGDYPALSFSFYVKNAFR